MFTTSKVSQAKRIASRLDGLLLTTRDDHFGLDMPKFIILGWLLGAIEALLDGRENDALRFVSHIQATDVNARRIPDNDPIVVIPSRIECILATETIYDSDGQPMIEKGDVMSTISPNWESWSRELELIHGDSENYKLIWGVWTQGV